jgi:hypothetical protein
VKRNEDEDVDGDMGWGVAGAMDEADKGKDGG